jgi:hypothetical protein
MAGQGAAGSVVVTTKVFIPRKFPQKNFEALSWGDKSQSNKEDTKKKNF